MDTLTLQPGVAISYDPEYLDPETIRRFSQANVPAMSLAEAQVIQQALRVEPYSLTVKSPVIVAADEAQDETSVINNVLDAMAQDDEFAAKITAKRDQLVKETRSYIHASMVNPINPTLVSANRASLSIQRTFANQRVVYTVDGQPVLEFDRALLTQPLGISLEMLLAWTSLIWDSCSFLGSCFDIWFPKSNANTVRKVSGEVGKEISNWQRFVNGMKKIKDAVTPSDKIKRLIGAFKVAKNLFAVAKSILRDLSLWQKIKTALQFLASVALLFVSAGASLVAKAIKLIAELAYVVADVINILQLEGALRAAPERETSTEPGTTPDLVPAH